jgi:transcriptional regulator with XRE-family HTH domain
VTDAEMFGERIRVLRTARGLTQEKLAGKADLTTGFVNNVEHGRKVPSLTTILKLARALDVDAAELMADFVLPTLKRMRL